VLAISLRAFDAPDLDPLTQVTASFPGSIKLKAKGRLLEFCPDNTCDGFVAGEDVSSIALRDFTYLYIYFLSDYYVLQQWRSQAESKKVADRVLSKPEYRDCRNQKEPGEAGRCVMRQLSAGGKIKLIFVRYDENMRNVVPKNLAKILRPNRTAPKQ
jgi:hypothetical protein